MIKIVVCDDNKNFLRELQKIFNKCRTVEEIQVEFFSDGNDLITYCKNNSFNIVFMDIDLGDISGIDITQKLKVLNIEAVIIFISDYDVYFKDIAQVESFKFISKLGIYDIKKLENGLNAAINRVRKGKPKTYIIKHGNVRITLFLENVKCFYSQHRTIHFVIVHGGVDGEGAFYEKLDNLEKDLEKIDESFVRISKSYIVNMRYIKVINRKEVQIGKQILKITDRYRTDFILKYYNSEYYNI